MQSQSEKKFYNIPMKDVKEKKHRSIGDYIFKQKMKEQTQQANKKQIKSNQKQIKSKIVDKVNKGKRIVRKLAKNKNYQFRDDQEYYEEQNVEQEPNLSQGSIRHSYNKNVMVQMMNLFMKDRDGPDAHIFGIIPQDQIKEFSIKRVNSGVHYFRPIFQLYDDYGNIIAKAKKSSTFTFQIYKIEQKGTSLIGRIESNFKGNLLNIQFCLLQAPFVAASVEYSNGFLDFYKPRDISVYLRRSITKVNNLQIQKLQKKASSKQLLQQEKSLDFSKIENRKPIFCKETKSYKLDFKGKAPKSSIKNFILEQKILKGRNSLLFAKSENNKYLMQITHPFCPFTGFAVCLTSFNGKLFCQ